MPRGQKAKARRRPRKENSTGASDASDPNQSFDGIVLEIEESRPGRTDKDKNKDKKRVDSAVHTAESDTSTDSEDDPPGAPRAPLKCRVRRYVRRMWPCKIIWWLRRVVPAFCLGIWNTPWQDKLHTLGLLIAVVFAGWVAIEGLLRIFQGVSAQEQCSIVYVTIPGPIITVSLVGATPTDPARGTYYYSVVNGTTEWLNSIAPPTRVSSFISSTMQITYTPPLTTGVSPSPSPSTMGVPSVPSSTLVVPSPTNSIPSRGPSPPGFSYPSSRPLPSSSSTPSAPSVPSVPPPVPITLTSVVTSTFGTSTAILTGTSVSTPSLPPPPPVTVTTVLTQTSGLSTAIVTVTSVLSTPSAPPTLSVPPSIPPVVSSGSPVTPPGNVPSISSPVFPPIGSPPTPTVPASSTIAPSSGGFMTIQTSVPSPTTTSGGFMTIQTSMPSSSSSPGWMTIQTSVPSTPITQSSTSTPLWTSSGNWVTMPSSRSVSPSSGTATMLTSLPSATTTDVRFTIQTSVRPPTSSTPQVTLPSSPSTTVSATPSSLMSSTGVPSMTTSAILSSSSLSSVTPSSSLQSSSSMSSSTSSPSLSSSTSGFSLSTSPSASPSSALPSTATAPVTSPSPPLPSSTSSRFTNTTSSFNLTTSTASLWNSTTTSPRSCTDSTPVPGCSNFEGEFSTRVLSFGNTELSFAFPTPDVTTTQSYWVGTYPPVVGSETFTIPSTTRTARQTPLSSLEPLGSFVLASPTGNISNPRRSMLQARQIPSGFETLISPGNGSVPSVTTQSPMNGTAPSTPTQTPAAQPTGCGEYGNFTLNFDDTTVEGDNRGLMPVHGMTNPYHHLFYANGYTYMPDKWEPYPAVSQPNVAMFLPIGTSLLPNTPFAGTLLPGEFGSGPRGSVSAYWFNAYYGYFGCALNGITPCDLRISGYRWDTMLKQEVLAIEKHVSIPACWGFIKCKLQLINFDEPGFRGLSGIQFNAYTSVLGIPQVFFADDLNLGWWNQTCAAGILRIGHR